MLAYSIILYGMAFHYLRPTLQFTVLDIFWRKSKLSIFLGHAPYGHEQSASCEDIKFSVISGVSHVKIIQPQL